MPEERPQTPGPGATPAQPGGDPSMEDILASIRRILNEDEPGPAPAPSQPAPPGPATPGPEPLNLTEEMLVGGSSTQPEPSATPTPPTPPTPPAVPEPAPVAKASAPPSTAATPAPGQDALVAPDVAAAASASVGHLLRRVAAERSSAISRGGPTIEDVVREELRPLLKDWLDHHLPAVVERLVRAEIERVVGRALS